MSSKRGARLPVLFEISISCLASELLLARADNSAAAGKIGRRREPESGREFLERDQCDGNDAAKP
jgi:hypothetical protein